MAKPFQSALWRQDLSNLLRLALPLVFVQLNYHFTGAVDTALAGRMGALVLGATALGATLFTAASVMGHSCGYGSDPLIAQAVGRGHHLDARSWLWQGIYATLILCLPLCSCAWAFVSALPLFGIDPLLVDGARDYLLGRLPFLPAIGIVSVQRAYLQAYGSTRPVVLTSIIMNLLNVGLDILFLYGDAALLPLGLPPLGLPTLGVFGLGLASGIAAGVQLLLLSVTLRHWPPLDAVSHALSTLAAPPTPSAPPSDGRAMIPELTTRELTRFRGPAVRRVLELGLPAGMQNFAEVGIFALVTVLMGGLGTAAIAAHQTALMLASLSFAVCVGIGSATSVEVARAIGAGDWRRTRRSGVLGIGLGLVLMTLSALVMWFCPESLARLITRDPAVLADARGLLQIAAFFQLADGAQAVAAGALRGAGATRWAFVANLLAHWGLGVPAALLLAYVYGMGPAGLWWGLTVGLTVVAIALSLRFWTLSARPIAAL